RLFAAPLVEAARSLDRLDFKTLLQERTARLFDVAPVYVISESGPDHAKTFVATVLVNGRTLGNGTGKSKKTAEQVAARTAFDALATELLA
ncbi:MAG: putative dsRNA-binding protein, partial [Ilumatobacteraceae bacterium]